jgi:hypothetical protein
MGKLAIQSPLVILIAVFGCKPEFMRDTAA